MASSRRPRPRSPPSMYVAYDTPPPRAPKPLINLDKKPKDSETRSKAERSKSPTWAPSTGSLLRGRLRRKTGDVATEEASAGGDAVPPDELYAHPGPFSHTAQTIDLSPARADTVVTRLLGNLKAVRLEPVAQSTAPGRDDASVSDIYSMDATSMASVGSSVSDGGWAGSSESECFTDDSYLTDESALTPIEFRPPSAAGFQPQTVSNVDGGPPQVESLWLLRPLQESHRHVPRSESGASTHGCPVYSRPTSPSRRPDTPFVDTHYDGPKPQGGVIRTELREGWVGEWNQNDIKAVIHKLRSLK
ncbi:hypothetical protein FB451DRAFT_1292394 [Mycena latifolia]|nr:hypothetical protein FB451DRAFT_1292394 [Mycena latifolia]